MRTRDLVEYLDFVPFRRKPGSFELEVRRGDAQWTVRRPSAQASTCASWLSELVVRALK